MADLATLRDLQRRLREATGEDEDIDLAIAFAIVPGVVCLRYNSVTDKNEPFTHWRYTASIDAAVALIYRLFPAWRVRWQAEGDGTHEAFLENKGDFGAICANETQSFAVSAALALCLALVSALIAVEEGKGESHG